MVCVSFFEGEMFWQPAVESLEHLGYQLQSRDLLESRVNSSRDVSLPVVVGSNGADCDAREIRCHHIQRQAGQTFAICHGA